MWDDFNSDDFINTAVVVSAGTAIAGEVLGVPPVTVAGAVGGFVTGLAVVGKNYLKANTQYQDVAYDLYVNPVGPLNGYCLINNPSVVDRCQKIPLPGIPSVAQPFFYSELDYTTQKACCDMDKCNAMSGVVNCIDTWQYNGIDMATLIKCINKWQSS
jgi:hypothetical protein